MSLQLFHISIYGRVQSRRTYECVSLHIGMSHVTHYHTWASHVTSNRTASKLIQKQPLLIMDDLFHTHVTYFTPIYEAHHTHPTCKRQVTRVNKSHLLESLTQEQLCSLWITYVTYTHVIHMFQARHTSPT